MKPFSLKTAVSALTVLVLSSLTNASNPLPKGSLPFELPSPRPLEGCMFRCSWRPSLDYFPSTASHDSTGAAEGLISPRKNTFVLPAGNIGDYSVFTEYGRNKADNLRGESAQISAYPSWLQESTSLQLQGPNPSGNSDSAADASNKQGNKAPGAQASGGSKEKDAEKHDSSGDESDSSKSTHPALTKLGNSPKPKPKGSPKGIPPKKPVPTPRKYSPKNKNVPSPAPRKTTPTHSPAPGSPSSAHASGAHASSHADADKAHGEAEASSAGQSQQHAQGKGDDDSSSSQEAQASGVPTDGEGSKHPDTQAGPITVTAQVHHSSGDSSEEAGGAGAAQNTQDGASHDSPHATSSAALSGGSAVLGDGDGIDVLSTEDEADEPKKKGRKKKKMSLGVSRNAGLMSVFDGKIPKDDEQGRSNPSLHPNGGGKKFTHPITEEEEPEKKHKKGKGKRASKKATKTKLTGKEDSFFCGSDLGTFYSGVRDLHSQLEAKTKKVTRRFWKRKKTKMKAVQVRNLAPTVWGKYGQNRLSL
ncbi:mucin-1-like [Cyclospora cayetanensis]|uniref:Mucin-1-like n=1 Tax=Cyclospora cayetanensis TaxID=88456 RepID=A0A6P6RX83_9EIME|nr:mucin-1-like [Cyclospora cayetanensis]